MARTLDQILASLEPNYAASRKLVQDRQAGLPGAVDAEIKAADAKLAEANTNIVDAARRRGLGFSGIPVGEQAKYAATEYAPAVARVRENARNQAMSLEEALLGLEREKRTNAESIYNQELARDFQERQFQEQIRQFNEQQAMARASSSLGAGAYLGAGGQAPAARNRPGTAGDEQWAYNSVASMLSTRDTQGLMDDYLATARSAQRGNIGDLYKLQMYRAKRPDLFKNKYSWEKNYGF